jgi:cytochrome c biogenesis protein CcmG/thiol:disulfide interchange protein DsbE
VTGRLSRSQVLALLGVVVLLIGALALRDRGEAAPRAAGPDLAALRAQASLEPCPQGLGPALPDLVLPCLGGGPDVEVRSAPPGRPTLVNVWASWCAPCADEAPELAAFAGRAGNRVAVVGVLTSDEPHRGLAFSDDFGMRYPSLVDADGQVLRAHGSGPPVTLFLDADGTLVHTEHGAFTDLAEVEALVAEHLGVRL